jgi:hypothetical protein
MRGYGGGGGWREMPTKYSNKLRSERERRNIKPFYLICSTCGKYNIHTPNEKRRKRCWQ